MQKAIASTHGKNNWLEVPVKNILDDKIFEWGISTFSTPDKVEIQGISTISPKYQKTDSKTVVYSTEGEGQVLKLSNKVKTPEELFSIFASLYKDAEGNPANATAASIATWLTIKNNQYIDAFKGKINNDFDRTDEMLLSVLGDLDDGKTIELKLPSNFAVNYMASGKKVDDISTDKAYHRVHEMSPSETHITIDGNKQVNNCNSIPGAYHYTDILMYYFDPDTGEKIGDKVKTENDDGTISYNFEYNHNVADLNAKAYSIYEQVAFANLSYFASEQAFNIDNTSQTFKYGVVDVLPGY